MLLPIALAVGKRLLGGAARRRLSKAAGKVGALAGKAIGLVARNPGTTAAAGGMAIAGVNRLRSGGAPPMPTGFQQPAGRIRRVGQRLIPGGKTGLEFTPYEGAEVDRLGRSIAVYPETRDRLYAPPGYVIVRPWGPEGDVIAMLKGPARAMGLWHPDPKPPVSGWDMRAITRAAAAKKRVKKLSSKVGLSCKGKC